MSKKPMKTSTKQAEEYDVLILGSGGAGKLAAWNLAKKGKKVAVVERKYIGGACPNIACLPSKNVILSAKVASYFFRSHEFGITKDNTRINMAAVRERKRNMVTDLVNIHLDLYKKSGAELIMGAGRFTGPKTIEVTPADGPKRVLTGKKVVINTGTRAAIDATPGLADAKPLTHVEALELDHIPQHLLVIGGGFVGLELSQAMRRFGSRVTIIERSSRLASREDEDASAALHELFKDEGVDVITDAQVNRVEGKSGEWVKLHVTRKDSDVVLEGSDLLVATGRTPNTENIGLELAGVKLTDRGFIKVNERLETTAPDVWAAGDCAGSPFFTHISENDFRVVHDNILGGNHVTTGRQVPFCVFTDPEFARIGLNETEAKAQGIAYRVAKIPMAAVLRTRTISEMRGYMKALVDATSDRILGFTIFGAEGGEMMTTVQIAMLGGLPYTMLADAIIAHPTMHEGLNSLFAAVPAKK
jgi:pyruvate/2-oxoglutarate dehydrogenase complex dihydrolipoamide dehydrogenase (E3) component